MTIEDIANYCQFKGCRAIVGSPDVGFVHIDGDGVSRSANYGRFHMLNELASQPVDSEVVANASIVKIEGDGDVRQLTPEEFESEYLRLQALIGD